MPKGGTHVNDSRSFGHFRVDEPEPDMVTTTEWERDQVRAVRAEPPGNQLFHPACPDESPT